MTGAAAARRRGRSNASRCHHRLEGRAFLLGDAYSIADMASWPWVLIVKPRGQSLDGLPNVMRWRAAIKARPADDERRILFNQKS